MQPVFVRLIVMIYKIGLFDVFLDYRVYDSFYECNCILGRGWPSNLALNSHTSEHIYHVFY